MAIAPAANARPSDENTVAKHVHGLLRNANEHDDRTLWRNFRVPPVFAGLQRAGWFSGGRALGVK